MLTSSVHRHLKSVRAARIETFRRSGSQRSNQAYVEQSYENTKNTTIDASNFVDTDREIWNKSNSRGSEFVERSWTDPVDRELYTLGSFAGHTGSPGTNGETPLRAHNIGGSSSELVFATGTGSKTTNLRTRQNIDRENAESNPGRGVPNFPPDIMTDVPPLEFTFEWLVNQAGRRDNPSSPIPRRRAPTPLSSSASLLRSAGEFVPYLIGSNSRSGASLPRASTHEELTTVGQFGGDNMLGTSLTPLPFRPPHSQNLVYDNRLTELLEGLRTIDLSMDIYDQTEHLNAHGGSSDVFMAKSRRHGNMIVAIKRLRLHVYKNKSVSKIIFRELRVWSSLHHPNILPLLGYVMRGNYFSFVSKWMVNGSARDYIDKNLDIPKVQMSLGIAKGLGYLHYQDILHSDLKSDNIFISDSGEPLLADFGISRIMTATCTTTSTSIKGSTRWMAIELWSDEDNGEVSHSKETDIWALGMVIYELLTRRIPFYEITNDVKVSFAIARGHLPSQPSSLGAQHDEDLWSICQECWKTKLERPNAATIRQRLSMLSIS